jgi:(S)-2-hydroxyglutarate dehydrogenase
VAPQGSSHVARVRLRSAKGKRKREPFLALSFRRRSQHAAPLTATPPVVKLNPNGRPRDSFDLVVIGAGLIGLATADAFLRRNPKARVALFEKEPQLGLHQSGRNSGVVHAGLYYPAGSLKATLCREGRAALLEFADEHSIPYSVSGKLVVALDESEFPRLEELWRRGEANGLTGLRDLSRGDLIKVEPHVAGARALHVPETAVIDFRLVAEALAARVTSNGANLFFGEEVLGVGDVGSRTTVRTGNRSVGASLVIACAGLQADRVAALTGSASDAYRVVPFRGDFYALSPEAAGLVNGLIYPVPDPAFPFLGVHFTRRVDGQVWAGPNAVPALAREGYGRASIDARDARDLLGYPGTWRLARKYARTGIREIWRDTVKHAAVREMRRYLPSLTSDQVTHARPGVRAQVVKADGSLVDDFLIERAGNVVHVVNAPSPAATASLAIGEWIVRQASEAA